MKRSDLGVSFFITIISERGAIAQPKTWLIASANVSFVSETSRSATIKCNKMQQNVGAGWKPQPAREVRSRKEAEFEVGNQERRKAGAGATCSTRPAEYQPGFRGWRVSFHAVATPTGGGISTTSRWDFNCAHHGPRTLTWSVFCRPLCTNRAAISRIRHGGNRPFHLGRELEPKQIMRPARRRFVPGTTLIRRTSNAEFGFQTATECLYAGAHFIA